MKVRHYLDVKFISNQKHSYLCFTRSSRTATSGVFFLFLVCSCVTECLFVSAFVKISTSQRWQQQKHRGTKTSHLFSSTIRRTNQSAGSSNAKDDSDNDNKTPKPKDGTFYIKEKSNFWKTVVERSPIELSTTAFKPKDKNEKLSSIPWLDADGPLPSFAYQTLGGGVVRDDDMDQNELLPTCRISIGIDLTNIGITEKNHDNTNKEENNYQPRTKKGQRTPKTKQMSSSYWSENSKIDPNDICKDIQHYIDSGFNTFTFKAQTNSQQKWGESNVVRRLQQTTPKSVLRDMHFIHSLQAPQTKQDFDKVRETIVSSLHRMNYDYMDTLQLQYNPTSPYHYDTLDYLQELQRDGLVRSIAGQNMPSNVLQTIHQYGFHIDSNQITCNVMDSSQYTNPRLLQTLRDLSDNNDEDHTNNNSIHEMKLRLSCPLAGGLLTNKYANHVRGPPPSWEMTPSSLYAMKAIIPKWHSQYKESSARSEEIQRRQHGSNSLPPQPPFPSSFWNAYQRTVLQTVTNIAQKHGVSHSSVALRWALQLDHTANVVTSCTLGRRSDDNSDTNGGISKKGRGRPYALRQVFTFELDDDDMDQLWKLSGGKPKTLLENPNDSFLLDFDNLSEEDYERFLL